MHVRFREFTASSALYPLHWELESYNLGLVFIVCKATIIDVTHLRRFYEDVVIIIYVRLHVMVSLLVIERLRRRLLSLHNPATRQSCDV